MQTPAELIPIPDASRMLPDASGMRRDFEFRQLPAKFSILAKFRKKMRPKKWANSSNCEQLAKLAKSSNSFSSKKNENGAKQCIV